MLEFSSFLFLGTIGACLTWRLLCHFFAIPWPHWLAWMLEAPNPYMMSISPSRRFVEELNIASHMQVLDFGAGAGRIAEPVYKCLGPGGSLTCIDMQKKMLDKIDRRLQVNLGSRLKLSQICFQRTPSGKYPELGEMNQFDLIYALTVVGELPNLKAFLKECNRLLKPGGKLVIGEVIPDPCFVSKRALIAAAHAADLKLDTMHNRVLSYTAVFHTST